MHVHFSRILVPLLLVTGCAAAASGAASPAEWASLFDGETLNGWHQENGKATYTVEDGAIVGRSAPGSPNSFLVTDRSYDDFELEFEVMADTGFNSGVQIRSRAGGSVRPKDPPDRVNGPQIEVESSGPDGAESGYLFGEASGSWLTPGEQRKPHKVFQDGEWNHFRVVARGPRIQTFINGQPIGDLTLEHDYYETYPSGFIGLQVHGVGKRTNPYEVRWRNLRIRELGGPSGP